MRELVDKLRAPFLNRREPAATAARARPLPASHPPETSGASVALAHFLAARTDSEAGERLEHLLARHALPVISTVLARRLGVYAPGALLKRRTEGGDALFPHTPPRAADLRQSHALLSDYQRALADLSHAEADTVYGQTVGDLIEQLGEMRERKARAGEIRDFEAYVATTAYRAFGALLEEKNPERRRLKQKTRYALRHHPRLALWAGTAVRRVRWGGLKEWEVLPDAARAAREVAHSDRLAHLRDAPREMARAWAGKNDGPETMRVSVLLLALLDWLKHAVELETLVNLLARIQGIAAPVMESLDAETGESASGGGTANLPLAALGPDAALAQSHAARDGSREAGQNLMGRAEQRVWWERVCALPARERLILLLHFRDTSDNVWFGRRLAEQGIIRLTEAADALDLSHDDFAALWSRLPLDDDAIALYMDLKAENVRQLRFQARKRLQKMARSRDE